MVSSDVAKKIQEEELKRNTAPDKKCPTCNKQIVKIGTLCPYCGVKVTA